MCVVAMWERLSGGELNYRRRLGCASSAEAASEASLTCDEKGCVLRKLQVAGTAILEQSKKERKREKWERGREGERRERARGREIRRGSRSGMAT
jgi:hypothetical protein